MGWEERRGGAAYTPPSGVRIAFDFQVVPESFTLRGTEFQFSGFTGTYVQQHGSSGRRHPLRIYLTGPDHDKQAKVFRAAVSEDGVGELELPLKDPIDAVPLGEVKLVQDYVTRANETAFDVVFVQTTGAAFLARQEDAASAAELALSEFGSASGLNFSNSLDLGGIAEQAGFIATFKKILKAVKNATGKVAAVQEKINDEFEDAFSLINETIDTLIKDPLDLAFETNRLISLPSKAITSIDARMDGYSNLALMIFSEPLATPGGPGGLGPNPGMITGTGNDAQPTNNFHAFELAAGGAIAGMARSTLYTSTSQGSAAQLPGVSQSQADATAGGSDTGDSAFATAEQAVVAAETLLDQMDLYDAWSDANYVAINGDEIIPTPVNTQQGDSTDALRRAIALSAGYLIKLSFSLARARAYTTQGPRNFIELCAELYGTIDDEVLDFFIASNKFTTDELLEIPAGREVVFYLV